MPLRAWTRLLVECLCPRLDRLYNWIKLLLFYLLFSLPQLNKMWAALRIKQKRRKQFVSTTFSTSRFCFSTFICVSVLGGESSRNLAPSSYMATLSFNQSKETNRDLDAFSRAWHDLCCTFCLPSSDWVNCYFRYDWSDEISLNLNLQQSWKICTM